MPDYTEWSLSIGLSRPLLSHHRMVASLVSELCVDQGHAYRYDEHGLVPLEHSWWSCRVSTLIERTRPVVTGVRGGCSSTVALSG